MLYDEPTITQSYTDEASILASFGAFIAFLKLLGTETNQRAVGFMIDHEWYELEFA